MDGRSSAYGQGALTRVCYRPEALRVQNAPGHTMIEQYAIRDEQGRTMVYVSKETSRYPAVFSRAPRPHQPESPTIETICRLVGLFLLAATVLLIWVMVTAT